MDLQGVKEFDAKDKYGIRASHRGMQSLSDRYSKNRGLEMSECILQISIDNAFTMCF